MALSTIIFVGEARCWLPELVERSRNLKVTSGFEKDADVGPLISCASMERVKGIIDRASDQGAKLLLDGRHFKACPLYLLLSFLV